MTDRSTAPRVKSKCPSCSAVVKGTSAHVGRTVRCPGCKQRFEFLPIASKAARSGSTTQNSIKPTLSPEKSLAKAIENPSSSEKLILKSTANQPAYNADDFNPAKVIAAEGLLQAFLHRTDPSRIGIAFAVCCCTALLAWFAVYFVFEVVWAGAPRVKLNPLDHSGNLLDQTRQRMQLGIATLVGFASGGTALAIYCRLSLYWSLIRMSKEALLHSTLLEQQNAASDSSSCETGGTSESGSRDSERVEKAVCDAHGAIERSEKQLLPDEGYLLQARYVQRSVIQEKLIERDIALMASMGFTRAEYRRQLEQVQGSSPWLICKDCLSVLGLDPSDVDAARAAAKNFWRDASTRGHAPIKPSSLTSDKSAPTKTDNLGRVERIDPFQCNLQQSADPRSFASLAQVDSDWTPEIVNRLLNGGPSEHRKGLKLTDKIIRHFPDFWMPYSWHAKFQMQLGDEESAYRKLSIGLSTCVEKSELCNVLAELSIREGNVIHAAGWSILSVRLAESIDSDWPSQSTLYLGTMAESVDFTTLAIQLHQRVTTRFTEAAAAQVTNLVKALPAADLKTLCEQLTLFASAMLKISEPSVNERLKAVTVEPARKCRKCGYVETYGDTITAYLQEDQPTAILPPGAAIECCSCMGPTELFWKTEDDEFHQQVVPQPDARKDCITADKLPEELDYLRHPVITEQCIAALNQDQQGIVLIRKSMVNDYRKSSPGLSTEQAAASAAAMLGILACSGGMDPRKAVEVSARMVEQVATVKLIRTAADVMPDVPSQWDVPVYQVFFQ